MDKKLNSECPSSHRLRWQLMCVYLAGSACTLHLERATCGHHSQGTHRRLMSARRSSRSHRQRTCGAALHSAGDTACAASPAIHRLVSCLQVHCGSRGRWHTDSRPACAPAVQLNGNRGVMGVLRGFDQFMNLVLDGTVDTKTKADIGMVVSFGVCHPHRRPCDACLSYYQHARTCASRVPSLQVGGEVVQCLVVPRAGRPGQQHCRHRGAGWSVRHPAAYDGGDWRDRIPQRHVEALFVTRDESRTARTRFAAAGQPDRCECGPWDIISAHATQLFSKQLWSVFQWTPSSRLQFVL
jgi:LSM domain